MFSFLFFAPIYLLSDDECYIIGLISIAKKGYAMKTYDTVIVGSGYYAFGYAMTHGNTLIVEETQLADRHFSGCLRGFGYEEAALVGEGARALVSYMRDKGVLRVTRVCVPALEAGLCDFFMGHMPEILLGTVCTDTVSDEQGYLLTLCNNEGLSTVRAHRVVDTRVAHGHILNVLIQGDIGSVSEDVSVSDAFYDGQRRLSLCFDGETDINRAKVKVYPILKRLLSPTGAQVLQMAYRMHRPDAAAPYEDGQGILHVDETFYGDPFAAFEKGELQQ